MSDDTCSACGQKVPTPQNVWLTTQQVRDRFGYDPTPHILSLKSKLEFVALNDGSAWVRMWLLDSVEAFSP